MTLPAWGAVAGLLAFCVVTEIACQLSFKGAADRAQSDSRYALALAMQPLLWAGIALWAIEVVAWVLALQRAPLAIAYPIGTLTYAGVPLAGALILKERLTRSQIAGAGLVALGVLCVALSELS
jgi:undecaprenyl phosphate-alpha-L-ara4N flippase subunit ArnE